MPIRRADDLVAFQFLSECHDEVKRLFNRSPLATQNRKFCAQVLDALGDAEADVAEGFYRGKPGEFAQFLGYALASLGEARTRIRRGVWRGFYALADAELPLTWAARARQALRNLQKSQRRRQQQIARAPGPQRRHPGDPVPGGPDGRRSPRRAGPDRK